MEIKGERIIPAKRPVVWAALNDPGVLQRSIPGCETIDKVSDTELNATLTLKVGPVKARFKGNVKLVDLMPPEQYTIVGEGQGGPARVLQQEFVDVDLHGLCRPDGVAELLQCFQSHVGQNRQDIGQGHRGSAVIELEAEL
jgi:carbon monoxide dehydrogenase subunit G